MTNVIHCAKRLDSNDVRFESNFFVFGILTSAFHSILSKINKTVWGNLAIYQRHSNHSIETKLVEGNKMAIIYQFSKRTFRDITNEGVVDVDKVAADFIGSVIKVYERKGTIIVHIKDKKVNHASISNTNGQVKEWEIRYAIEQVLESEIKDVLVHVSRTGVIHVCTKEDNTFIK